ncbi:pyrophosphate-energized vacuolar membrane proton pump 1 [Tanacetum coccineum]
MIIELIMIVQLISMIVSVINDPKYDIAGIANHFLQIRLLRILRILGHGDADASDFMNDVLAKCTLSPEFRLAYLNFVKLLSEIIFSFSLAAMYGVVVVALGMLSTKTTILAIDTDGPISDNAGGIAEMAVMSHRIRERIDALDVAGKTTAAIGMLSLYTVEGMDVERNKEGKSDFKRRFEETLEVDIIDNKRGEIAEFIGDMGIFLDYLLSTSVEALDLMSSLLLCVEGERT